jgi:hypothetical protein
LVHQGVALRGHSDAGRSLQQVLLPFSKTYNNIELNNYLSHDIINEVLEIMYYEHVSILLSNIRGSQYYSIVAKETQNASHKEEIIFCFNSQTLRANRSLWHTSYKDPHEQGFCLLIRVFMHIVLPSKESLNKIHTPGI